MKYKPLLLILIFSIIIVILLGPNITNFTGKFILDLTGKTIDQSGSSVTVLGDHAPYSYTISPADEASSSSSSQTFICNATDDYMLKNITLYVWQSGTAYYNNTSAISGLQNSSSWPLTGMPDGAYTWNCLAYDNVSQKDWGNTNFSLTISTPSGPGAPGGSSSRGFTSFVPLPGNVVADVLFDVRVNILWKILAPGDILKAEIYIKNKGVLKPIDVLLHYDIRDYNGTVITAKKESVAMGDSIDLYRELEIPKYAYAPKDYMFYVNISYGDIKAIAADSFRLMAPEEIKLYYTGIGYLLLIAVILVIISIILILKTRKKIQVNSISNNSEE